MYVQLCMDIKVKVIPKSSRTELAGQLPDGTWKIRVAAAPEKGRANKALCAFLAEHFGVSQNSVTILTGESSHIKRIRIER